MIRSISFNGDGKIRSDIPIDDIKQILQDPKVMLWMDLSGDANKKIETILQDIFQFHQLSIDDALMETHVPRVDDWENYVYLVLRSVSAMMDEDLQIEIPELDIFLGSNYLVTYHKDPILEIETLWKACNRDERYLKKGPSNLFYHLADEMVNQYMPVIEQMSEVIDQIEDDIIDQPRTEMLSQIFKLKRMMLMMRRTLLPQREVFSKLARGDFEVVHEQSRVYYRDIYDHMVRLEEVNESLRDLVSGALDTYLSVVNNRMNEVMKTLTIITTLFMPLTFLTGFFGMNFFQVVNPLPAWTGKMAFVIMLSATGLIPLGMFLWMRRRSWM